MRTGLPRLLVPALLLPLLFLACSGPSNTDIESAVQKALEERVPVQLSGDMGGGRKATVEEVRVIEIGSAQGGDAHEYWPVKVYVQGSCEVGFFGAKRKKYEGETVYNVSIDGFGVWKASHTGF